METEVSEEMKWRVIVDDTSIYDAPNTNKSQVVVYLLVNPRSGSQEGRVYTEMEKDQFHFTCNTGSQAEVNIIDITVSGQMDGFKSSIHELSQQFEEQNVHPNDNEQGTANQNKLVVVNVGGDGTFMSIVQDLETHGVQIRNIVFSVLPFGTSNDLSRALNWGRAPSNTMLHDLETLVNELNSAKVIDFDIWEITIEADDLKGNIAVPKHGDVVPTNQTSMTKLMCHSMSIGLDGRIGINFELNRRRTRFWNKFQYAWEGVKNIFCWCRRRTLKVREVIAQMSRSSKYDVDPNSSDSINDQKLFNNDIEEQLIKENEEENDGEFVIASDRNKNANYYIRGNPVSLYCTNIATIMGGRAPIWRSGRNSVGIIGNDGQEISRQEFDDHVSYNDGKLEFATFDSIFHIGLCKAKRIAQAEGPFEFTFNQDRELITYMNIDGEFFKLENVHKLTIKKHFKEGEFKMLKNNPSNE